MARFFSHSIISVIYIPGPASIYSMVDANITYEAGEGKIDSKEVIYKASQKGCKKIYEIAKNNGFRFLDSRPYFREFAKTSILHGPEDYQHLNRTGQTFLAELIIKHILNNASDQESKACNE